MRGVDSRLTSTGFQHRSSVGAAQHFTSHRCPCNPPSHPAAACPQASQHRQYTSHSCRSVPCFYDPANRMLKLSLCGARSTHSMSSTHRASAGSPLGITRHASRITRHASRITHHACRSCMQRCSWTGCVCRRHVRAHLCKITTRGCRLCAALCSAAFHRVPGGRCGAPFRRLDQHGR